MVPRQDDSSFEGLISTPNLIGREALRGQIADAITKPGDDLRIVFLLGDGGIGKTWLLREALEKARSRDDVKAARDVVDFYHIQNHTDNGLIDAIYRLLGPLDEPFHAYERAHRAWERARLTGEVSGLSDHREAELAAFTEDFNRLVKKRRLVLALDTAERLVYGLQPDGERQAEQIAEVWSWLIEHVRAWQNVTLLIAGRPQAKALSDQLAASANGSLTTLTVEPFVLEESQAYFAAVAARVSSLGKHREAATIQNMTAQYGYIMHHLAQGNPILLALMLEQIAFEGVLPDIMRSYEPGALPDAVELAGQRIELEKALIKRLFENDKYSDLIRALGRTPKGMDADLLSKILGIDRREAEKQMEDLRNPERRFSFIKVRPADQRVFLHDEIYALLRRHLYADVADRAEARQAAEAIQSYYAGQLALWRKRTDEIWRPVEIESRDRLDRQRLAEEEALRQTLMAEIVYYRLRQDPEAGFRRYYRYMREAVLGGDVLLDTQLQVELVTFIEEQREQSPALSGKALDPAVIDGIMLMRPLERAFAEQNFQKVLDGAERAREEKASILAVGAPINGASLATWEASARIFLGDKENLDAAFSELDETIEEIKAIIDQPDPARAAHWRWRTQAVLALAYRVRGYGRWARGEMDGAKQDYRQSVSLFRRLNFLVELATALNDLGFVLAERGEWDDARALVGEAYRIRRQLGHRVTMALSLNTLAAINMLDGNFEAAVSGADKALAIFRALENKRGVGFALRTLAESWRRLSSTDAIPDPEKKVENLRRARDYAREALEIFMESREKLRTVQAHIEIGCACRDWVKVRMQYPNPRDNLDELVATTQTELRRAADLAGQSFFLRRLDALVNLAWLGLYAERADLFRQGIADAERALFSAGRPTSFLAMEQESTITSSPPQIWAQLGELYVLFGHGALHAFEKGGDAGRGYEDFWLRHYSDRSVVADAAYYYTVSLWCDAHVGTDYRDLQRAKAEIQSRFLALEAEQRHIFVRTVAAIEAEYGLKRSELHDFLDRRTLWHE